MQFGNKKNTGKNHPCSIFNSASFIFQPEQELLGFWGRKRKERCKEEPSGFCQQPFMNWTSRCEWCAQQASFGIEGVRSVLPNLKPPQLRTYAFAVLRSREYRGTCQRTRFNNAREVERCPKSRWHSFGAIILYLNYNAAISMQKTWALRAKAKGFF